MAAAAPALVPLNVKPRVEMLKLEQINESPTNPRRQTNKEADAELAESIKLNGVLQPVLVRPQGDDLYELVFGHRRLRACWAAGLTEVPAMVRALDDRGTLEAQLIENRDREDVHPLDEADAFQRLHETHKVAIEEIVAKLGKSRSYVYQRLSLTKLTAFARKAFLNEELSAAVAQLVARVPENLQKQAVESLRRSGHDARWARDTLMREFMLQLSEAPWKLDEVLGLKACTTCPSRTLNQRELFADLASKDDLCTDPTCFNAKKEAKWKERAAAARDAGQVVLEGAPAKKIVDSLRYGSTSGDVVSLDAKADPSDYSPKAKTWRQLLGKSLPTPILVKGDDGKPLEVLDKTAAKALVKELGVSVKVERAAPARSSEEEENKKKHELRKKVVRASITAFIDEAEAKQDQAVRELVQRALSSINPAELRPIARGFLGKDLPVEPDEVEKQLTEHLFTSRRRTAFLLLCEVIPNAAGGQWSGGYTDAFKDAAEGLGVDIKKLEAQVKAEEKEAKAAKGKKPGPDLVVRLPTKGKKAADGVTPLCPVPGCGVPRSQQGGGFCLEHTEDLGEVEKKAILARAKKLAALPSEVKQCCVQGCAAAPKSKNHGHWWCAPHSNLLAGERLKWVELAEKPAKKGGKK